MSMEHNVPLTLAAQQIKYLHFVLFSNELVKRYVVILQVVHCTLVGVLFDSILVHLKRVLQLFLVALLLLLYLAAKPSKRFRF